MIAFFRTSCNQRYKTFGSSLSGWSPKYSYSGTWPLFQSGSHNILIFNWKYILSSI